MKVIFMKNVSLIPTTYNKVKSWKLLDKNGSSLPYFSIFANLLVKKYSLNTRLSYCKNIALFIDYIEEANIVYKDEKFTKSLLVDIIESFSYWLLYGEQSGNEIALKIQRIYPSPNYSRGTINIIMASVRLFLSVSERIRLEQESLGENSDTKLIPALDIKENISLNTQHALIRNSMLAGVIASGPQLLKTCILPIKATQSYFAVERAFPFDKIIPLIESFTSYRDKALYMLCAASGCRIHEALQVILEDIDIKNRSIRLVDPFSRITHSTYRILTAEEKTKLSWKGRQTDRSVLIQPFGDLFFEYLEKYIKNEYIPHNKHDFLFQHIRGKSRGKPYFLSVPSTRFEAFQKAVNNIGLSNQLAQGVHSLRHMYGTYLVNYFPKADGQYGLPIAIVQKIMGHSTISATQKYARHDQALIAIELEYANNLVYSENDNKLNLLDMKKKALQSQLLQLEKESDEI